MKVIRKDIKVDVFNCGVSIVICSREDAPDYFKRLNCGIEYKESGAQGVTFTPGGFLPIIWLPKVPKKIEELATLSHECIHATHAILEDRGIDWTAQNDEVVAYTQAYLFKEILTALK